MAHDPERDADIFARAGRLAAEQIAATLSRCGVLSDQDSKALIEKVRDNAIADRLTQRELGLDNRERSMAPGVAVMLTPAGYEMALSTIDEYAEAGETEPFPIDLYAAEGENGLMTVSFDAGAYFIAAGNGYFFNEIEWSEKGRPIFPDGAESFCAPTSEIIIIHGGMQERWLNPEYSEDGSPRIS